MWKWDNFKGTTTRTSLVVQCRGHELDPGSGKIPRASDNEACAPQQDKPPWGGAWAPQQGPRAAKNT